MVMFNIGKGAYDATCSVFGAPHLIVGSMPQSSERIFSSGNERTTTFFNPPVRFLLEETANGQMLMQFYSGPTSQTWDTLSTRLIDSESLLI
jgi:hypothetical protein